MCNYTLLLIRNHTEALLCNPHVLLCNPKNCWCCFSSVWQALLLVTLSIGYFGFLATFSPTYGWMLLLRGLVGCGMGGSTQGCGRKSLSFSWPCWPMSAEVVYLISNLYLLVFSGEQAETGCFIQKLCIITLFFSPFLQALLYTSRLTRRWKAIVCLLQSFIWRLHRWLTVGCRRISTWLSVTKCSQLPGLKQWVVQVVLAKTAGLLLHTV